MYVGFEMARAGADVSVTFWRYSWIALRHLRLEESSDITDAVRSELAEKKEMDAIVRAARDVARPCRGKRVARIRPTGVPREKRDRKAAPDGGPPEDNPDSESGEGESSSSDHTGVGFRRLVYSGSF